MRKKNPDAAIRDLDRAAAQGDLGALERLIAEAVRRGDQGILARVYEILTHLLSVTPVREDFTTADPNLALVAAKADTARYRMRGIASITRGTIDSLNHHLATVHPHRGYPGESFGTDGHEIFLWTNGGARMHDPAWSTTAAAHRWIDSPAALARYQHERRDNPRARWNPGDALLRDLERAANQGDPRAWERLQVERIRRGLDPEIAGILNAPLASVRAWLMRNDPNGDYGGDDEREYLEYCRAGGYAPEDVLRELRGIAVAQILDGRPSPRGTRSAEEYLDLARRNPRRRRSR